MAVISREELVNAVTSRLGELPDDDGITLLENLSDTLDSYEAHANLDFEAERSAWESERNNYEQRLTDLDNDWRRRYTERFNQPVEEHKSESFVEEVIENPEAEAEVIDYEDLFTEKE